MVALLRFRAYLQYRKLLKMASFVNVLVNYSRNVAVDSARKYLNYWWSTAAGCDHASGIDLLHERPNSKTPWSSSCVSVKYSFALLCVLREECNYVRVGEDHVVLGNKRTVVAEQSTDALTHNTGAWDILRGRGKLRTSLLDNGPFSLKGVYLVPTCPQASACGSVSLWQI